VCVGDLHDASEVIVKELLNYKYVKRKNILLFILSFV